MGGFVHWNCADSPPTVGLPVQPVDHLAHGLPAEVVGVNLRLRRAAIPHDCHWEPAEGSPHAGRDSARLDLRASGSPNRVLDQQSKVREYRRLLGLLLYKLRRTGWLDLIIRAARLHGHIVRTRGHVLLG